jgi:hypothetical protein
MDDLKVAMIALLDRLTAAGWVERSAVTPEGVNVLWTDLGKRSIEELQPLLATVGFPLTESEQKCLLFLVARTTTGSSGSS